MSHLHALTARIRGEFKEMPGLKLTIAQACRLWHTDERAVNDALNLLIAEGVVTRTASGAFIALPRPRGRAAKAALGDTARPGTTTRTA